MANGASSIGSRIVLHDDGDDDSRRARRWVTPFADRLGLAVDVVDTRTADVTIVERADPSDIVVVGVDQPEGVTPKAFRSPARELLLHLQGPLIVVPPDDEGRLRPASDADPVLVGLDGSEANLAPAEWAKAVAHGLARPLVAVVAVDPSYKWSLRSDDLGPVDRRARREARLEGVEIHERFGAPERVLREASRRTSAHLTVVGVGTHRSLGEALFGDVVEHLVHRPPGPLAIVRALPGSESPGR